MVLSGGIPIGMPLFFALKFAFLDYFCLFCTQIVD